MNVTIRDGAFAVTINTRGAELHSVKNEDLDLEYIWQGDPAFWRDRAPFLFPIVGRLLDDKYILDGKEGTIPMHGFARMMEFTVTEQTENSVTLELHENEKTLQWYPFRFTVKAVYTLGGDKLAIRHDITNHTDRDMPFSIGEHPGFNAPLLPGDQVGDFYLEFSQEENALRWHLNDEIIDWNETYLNGNRIDVQYHTFDKGALIFKDLQSESVSLRCKNHDHGVTVDLRQWRFLGIWAKPHAPYVCIEPWNGIASSDWSSHYLWEKEGIRCLPAGETRDFTLNITFF